MLNPVHDDQRGRIIFRLKGTCKSALRNTRYATATLRLHNFFVLGSRVERGPTSIAGRRAASCFRAAKTEIDEIGDGVCVRACTIFWWDCVSFAVSVIGSWVP